MFQKDIGSCMECGSEGKESKTHVPPGRVKGVEDILEKSLGKKVGHASNNREC